MEASKYLLKNPVRASNSKMQLAHDIYSTDHNEKKKKTEWNTYRTYLKTLKS